MFWNVLECQRYGLPNYHKSCLKGVFRIFLDFFGFFWIFFGFFWNVSECFGIFPNFGLDFPGISQALAAEVEAGPGLEPILAVAGRRWSGILGILWNVLEFSGMLESNVLEFYGMFWNVRE